MVSVILSVFPLFKVLSINHKFGDILVSVLLKLM
jgi:hypothetical protein